MNGNHKIRYSNEDNITTFCCGCECICSRKITEYIDDLLEDIDTYKSVLDYGIDETIECPDCTRKHSYELKDNDYEC